MNIILFYNSDMAPSASGNHSFDHYRIMVIVGLSCTPIGRGNDIYLGACKGCIGHQSVFAAV